MAPWQAKLTAIRQVQTEILWLVPPGSPGLRHNPGASPYSIWVAERRIGQPLPPSYRAFLAESDGLSHFYDGACLLGTDRLGQQRYKNLLGSVCEREQTPVPDIGPQTRRTRRVSNLIPFGADAGGSTVFAFDPSVLRRDGEHGVVCWINEIGLRRDNFEDFLELVLELCENQLASLVAAASAA
ncbi:MAG: SMI1/KNR4 family protein [Polyangiaceae bacterium]|nr:SMI1/KNR4 family protein [Polyangiaceae bacterium]